MTDTPSYRHDPPEVGDERAMLIGFLEFHRATLRWKCEGLTADQLATKSAPPSTMSLLGLLRHLAEVERGWFRDFAGETNPPLYCSEADPDGEFDNVEPDEQMVFRAWADWRAEIEHANEIIARSSLDDTFVRRRRNKTISLRWVLIHMIEEYARHNGHADFLRERIDGAVGD